METDLNIAWYIFHMHVHTYIVPRASAINPQLDFAMNSLSIVFSAYSPRFVSNVPSFLRR